MNAHSLLSFGGGFAAGLILTPAAMAFADQCERTLFTKKEDEAQSRTWALAGVVGLLFILDNSTYTTGIKTASVAVSVFCSAVGGRMEVNPKSNYKWDIVSMSNQERIILLAATVIGFVTGGCGWKTLGIIPAALLGSAAAHLSAYTLETMRVR